MEDDQGTNLSRLDNEIALLQAIYPEQVAWNAQRREIKFSTSSEQGPRSPAVLVLRLPDNYLPEDGRAGALPTVISATGVGKKDLREKVTSRWQSLGLNTNEEVLDQMLADFQDLVQSDAHAEFTGQDDDSQQPNPMEAHVSPRYKTVIIWLHHLLATEKRKLALSPTLVSTIDSSGAGQISGLTKPGYPGIMVFAGPAELVDAHVGELKMQRWQAFQVRFEEMHNRNNIWTFEHDAGIKEVASMAELAAAIQDEGRREEFLKAVGVK